MRAPSMITNGPTLPLRRHALAALLLAGCLAAPRLALAHAVLVKSTPQAGAAVQAGSTEIELRYNERVDADRSTVTLAGPDGRSRTLKATGGGEPNVLRAPAAQLVPGTYTVSWQVLASDGHLTRGTFHFSVR